MKTKLSTGAIVRIALLTSVLTMPMLSQAAPAAAVDVADVTGTIDNQLTSIIAVGAAVLALVVSTKAFKWIRAAL